MKKCEFRMLDSKGQACVFGKYYTMCGIRFEESQTVWGARHSISPKNALMVVSERVVLDPLVAKMMEEIVWANDVSDHGLLNSLLEKYGFPIRLDLKTREWIEVENNTPLINHMLDMGPSSEEKVLQEVTKK